MISEEVLALVLVSNFKNQLMMDNQYFKELLNKRDLKATNPRINLLLQMQKYNSAMPYSTIQKAMKSIDRVTLYRTLETLVGQGVIHKAFQENSEVYYAICGKQCSKTHHHHEHIHFKCIKCESVTCEQLKDKLKISIPDYEIHQVSIHVKGVCQLCKTEPQK